MCSIFHISRAPLTTVNTVCPVSSVATKAAFLGGVACVCIHMYIHIAVFKDKTRPLFDPNLTPLHSPLAVSSVATKAAFLGGVAGMECNEHGGTTAWFTVPLATSASYRPSEEMALGLTPPVTPEMSIKRKGDSVVKMQVCYIYVYVYMYLYIFIYIYIYIRTDRRTKWRSG